MAQSWKAVRPAAANHQSISLCAVSRACVVMKKGTSTIVFSTTAGAFPLHVGSEALSPSGNQRRKATIDVWCVFVLTCGISCPPQHGTMVQGCCFVMECVRSKVPALRPDVCSNVPDGILSGSQRMHGRVEAKKGGPNDTAPPWLHAGQNEKKIVVATSGAGWLNSRCLQYFPSDGWDVPGCETRSGADRWFRGRVGEDGSG